MTATPDKETQWSDAQRLTSNSDRERWSGPPVNPGESDSRAKIRPVLSIVKSKGFLQADAPIRLADLSRLRNEGAPHLASETWVFLSRQLITGDPETDPPLRHLACNTHGTRCTLNPACRAASNLRPLPSAIGATQRPAESSHVSLKRPKQPQSLRSSRAATQKVAALSFSRHT
jgi:hypothetical protein